MIRSTIALVALALLALAAPAAAGPCEDLAAAYTAAPIAGQLAVPRAAIVCDLLVRKTLTLVPAEPGGGLRSLKIVGRTADATAVLGLAIRFAPNDTTASSSPAVMVDGAWNVVIRNLDAQGGLATYTSATGLDSIAGTPTGTGILVKNGAADVLIEHNRLRTFDKGVVLSKAVRPVVADNDIGGTRTGQVSGGGVVGPVRIAGNWLHDSFPVNWGSGDHADHIHLWTTTAPIEGVTIARNLLDQGAGAPVMGIYLDDNRHGLGFRNVAVNDNTVLGGNGQGARMEFVQGAFTGNLMLQSSGTDPRNAPHLVQTDGSVLTVAGNRMSDPNGALGAAANDNTIIAGGVQPAQALDLARWARGR